MGDAPGTNWVHFANFTQILTDYGKIALALDKVNMSHYVNVTYNGKTSK